MALITHYVAKDTHKGQKVEVKAKKVVWIGVGKGKVTAVSNHDVGIAGQISILGYNGDLNIYLRLNNNEDASAQKGPCLLQLNSLTDENAHYEAANGVMTVYAMLGGKEQNISISPCNNGEQTECKLFGHVNETVHLDPKN